MNLTPSPQAVAELLLAAPGIERYIRALPALLDPGRADELPAALTAAAADGPSADYMTDYAEAGELAALRRAGADATSIAAVTKKWQLTLNSAAEEAEKFADALDGERVPPPAGASTWAGHARTTRREVEGDADRPGYQQRRLQAIHADMEAAADAFRAVLRDKLADRRIELEQRRAELASPDAASQAEKLLDQADGQLGASGSSFLALTKLDQVADLLRTGGDRRRPPEVRRLPVGVRRNPLGDKVFDLERVQLFAAQAKAGGKPLPNALTEYLPTADALDQAAEDKGFLRLHTRNAGLDWDRYFGALERWVGLDGQGRGKKQYRPDMPNLAPAGKELLGRWTFLFAAPWAGAPFYHDGTERKVLAVVRLRTADLPPNRPQAVVQRAAATLRLLAEAAPETDDERRFRATGLVLVLLPGAALSVQPYAQFRKAAVGDLALAGNLQQRVAFADDLDLLRLLPVPAGDRLRGLLELALPRFPDVLADTFQNMSWVRPFMFFGREDELTRLKSKTAVVYSGRRMGKSSLLMRLLGGCDGTDQRAVYVGCSGVPHNRPWVLLGLIEQDLIGLLRREGVPAGDLPTPTPPGPQGDADQARQHALDGFRRVLAGVLDRLAARRVRTLYVLLDEADNFVLAEMHETSGGATRAKVSWFLKDLQDGDPGGRLRFVFAGYDQLALVTREPHRGTSAFGNWGGEPMRLGPLADADARMLAAAPLAALGITLTDDAVERVLDYTDRHASLIQAFAQRLADWVFKQRPAWPLEDVAASAADLTAVNAGRSDAGTPFGEQADETLGLNLEVARHYPLKLLFLSLACPTGAAGRGRLLGPAGFTLADAAAQVADDPDPVLTDAQLSATLDLLVQLGLLDRPPVADDSRGYRFRANHYVRRLRTQNGFRERLAAAVADWRGRTAADHAAADPRLVWTVADADLRAVQAGGPAVFTGLPRTGRERLAEVLRLEQRAGDPPRGHLAAEDPAFADRLAAWRADPAAPLVVSDPNDRAPWPAARDALRWAAELVRPLWWVGGPRLAWELAADPDLALTLDPWPLALGPLTPAELEPWTARPPAGQAATAVLVPDRDRGPILAAVGGLLPVLEEFRGWLVGKYRTVPDTLKESHALEFREAVRGNTGLAAAAAGRLADGLPAGLRAGVHALYAGAAEFGTSRVPLADLAELHPDLAAAGPAGRDRVACAAGWLGLVPRAADPIEVPYDTAAGLLLRHPRFAAP